MTNNNLKGKLGIIISRHCGRNMKRDSSSNTYCSVKKTGGLTGPTTYVSGNEREGRAKSRRCPRRGKDGLAF